MKLNNGSKIITEDDIILSDGKSTLSDILYHHEQDIDQLKSNVKWIYKYGGVGSGGGGGGTVQSFSIYAALNGIQLKDQSIVLNGQGLYSLNIRINNPNGASFNVRYSYTTKSSTGNIINQEQTVILSIENNYQYNTQINLNNNDNLQITVSDGNETKQVMCSYVTSPYEFSLSLVDDYGNQVSNEYFIETAARNGLNIKLDYVISIPASVNYLYNFNGNSYGGQIIDTNNSILFPIDKSLFEPSNAGIYSAVIDFQIVPTGQDLISFTQSISFSLIPEDLYILLNPSNGVIYGQESEDPYLFNPGYITFNYRVYEGISQNRTYAVNISLNGNPIVNQSVVERQQYSFKLFSVTAGLNTLQVSVSRTSIYTKTYYFYVQESSISLDWFEEPTKWTQFYYRINETSENFSSYKDLLYIEQTVNNSPIRIAGIQPPNASANALINTHIAIGLQYNAINSENPTIFNFYSNANGDTPVLSIQQSQVTRQGQISNLYIRKQTNCNKDDINQYHLVQLYSQYIKKIDNQFYYEISLYIDGILESVFGQIVNYPLLINEMSIESVNCYINTIDVDFKEIDETTISNCDYDVYKYYIKYKNAILRQDIGNELLLTDYLKNFRIGLDGRVTTNQADINNIAANIDTPVLLCTYQDDGQFNSVGGFMEALEAGYGEDGTGIGSDMNFQVTVSYGAGNNSVEEIQLPSGFENARFRLALQGSSTKMYRVKNFTLSIENSTGTDQDEIYLYSPNFEEGNTNTFLPETEFTLKADIVDSSHSNNTSCGKFVNTVCRKFSNDIPEDGYYKGYIKNCLEGFPILMFLCHVKEDSATGEISNTYYYLGVYNFNLGRSSYYNLGYKDLSVFGDSETKLLTNAGNSFTFFKISPSDNILRQGLGVAEIQGGDPHFDFSQWDTTVLFQQSDTDTRYMFGDLVHGSNSTEDQLKNAISTFVEKVAKSGGYLFDYLKKKKGKYETDNVEEGAGYNAEVYKDGQPTGESKNQVPDYSKQYEKYLSAGGAWEFREKEGEPIKGSLNDLQNLILPDIDLGEQASLNYQSVAEYYTICMVLGLVDSVMKNLNIKSWNLRSDNSGTWYPAFYDMDTCLGINNQGNPISYFAFSDYWHSQISKTANDVEYPSAVRIYRDFSPNSLGENGYDVPTNYLFTVAKYSKLIFSDNSAEQSIYLSQYPQELYAKWRSNTVNTETNEGILRNADSFMDNFFSNNLAAICPALVSYNYRSKYLKLANAGDTVWVSTDFNKFNGTRVNEVRDWLEGRLHILDVYFSLNRSMPQAITYRTDEGTWETLMNGAAPVTDTTYSSNYDLANNDDIIILKDIFSADGGSGVQLSGFVSFQIRCPEFSPLQIYNQNGSVHENYILGGEKNQQVEFTTTGVQNVKLGGSQAWTYLQNINWISTSGLYITTDKLENIVGNSGRFTSLQLRTPNVKTISLTSPNYSGVLTLEGTDNYPNLSDINISTSQISLTCNDLNIRNLNISNMSAPNSSIQIRNCKYLQTLNTSNVRLNTLQIEGLKGDLKNFTLNNTNITNISIKAGEPGGTLTIQNDSSVNSITVQDFQKVIIQNCPKLTRVIINQGTVQDVEELQMSNCTADKLSITSEASSIEGAITLVSSKVKRVKFQQLPSIVSASLPDNTELLSECFRGNSSLQTVTGNNLLLNAQVFMDCPSYTGRSSDNSYTKFIINTYNLRECFYNTYVDWGFVKYIINDVVLETNNIQDVYRMFSQCKNIAYNLDNLKEDIQNPNNFPDFSKLNKVTNASEMFYSSLGGTMCAINKHFLDMGSNNGCNYDMFISSTEALNNYYVPIDLFETSINKIISMPFSQFSGSINNIVFVDTMGEIINGDIIMRDFLNPGGQAPSNLESLKYISINNSYQTLDWTNTFTSSWTSLREVNHVCGKSCRYKGYDNLFKDIPNRLNIVESWGVSALPDVTADYYTMYNWDKQVTGSYLFGVDLNRRTNLYANGCRKYISAEHYREIINKVLNSATLADISTLFRNTEVVGSIGEFKFGENKENRNITKASMCFSQFKNTSQLGGNTLDLQLSPNFFSNIPNLINVMGMFRGCAFSNPIPFNFFKKRQEAKETVFVKQGDGYVQDTLYTYTYTSNMIDMSYLFENATWASDAIQYNPGLYIIPISRLERGGDTYYTRTTIQGSGGETSYNYTEHKVEQNTEYTDAQNIKGGYIGNFGTTSNPQIGNANIDSLIVPPDLFYGLSRTIINTADYDYSQGVYRALYTTTPLIGIIPQNLLKANKQVDCRRLFENCIIIPKLTKSWKNQNEEYNVYVHFPSNYTTYTNLSDGFKSQYIVLQDITQSNVQIHNYSIVLLRDSISPATSSLSNAFNTTAVWSSFGHQLQQTTHQFNFFGELNENSIILGFDPSKFTSLMMDEMFYSPYMQAVRGNLFSSGYDAANILLRNTSSRIISVLIRTAAGLREDAFPAQCILPKASRDISQLKDDVEYRIYQSQIEDSTSSNDYYTRAGWQIEQ